jgi:hypothetical protein
MYLVRSKNVAFRARDGATKNDPMRLIAVTGWTPFRHLPSGVGVSGNAEAEVKVAEKESEFSDLLKASDKEAAEFSVKSKATKAAAAKKAHEQIFGKPKEKPAAKKADAGK